MVEGVEWFGAVGLPSPLKLGLGLWLCRRSLSFVEKLAQAHSS